jgi:hypothetical protein
VGMLGPDTIGFARVNYENQDSASSLAAGFRPEQAFSHMPGRIPSTPCCPSSSKRVAREEDPTWN